MAERSGGLRRRLAIALVGLSVLVGGVLALAMALIEQRVEQAELDHLLERELDFLAANRISPDAVDPRTSTLRYYRPGLAAARQPPPVLAALAPGQHAGVNLDGRRYQVLVRDLAAGDRAWLAHDTASQQERERGLNIFLPAAVLGGALLAWLASGWLARRALRPFDELVRQIRALNPEARGQRLSALERDRELEVIVGALNGYMTELDAVVERERAFAAAASHELRTPLAVIRGAAEVMAALPGTPPPPLARIERAVAQASADLDALLALSRTREAPPAQELRLDEYLPPLAEPYLAAAREQGTRLVWDLAPALTLRAAPGAVGIVFTNLLRNALRAAAGGTVRVILRPGLLAVEDDGPGIPESQRASLFTPGARGADGGSGMGLYIAAALASRYGWRLRLLPGDGRGVRAELEF